MITSNLLLKNNKHILLLEDTKKFILFDKNYDDNVLANNTGIMTYNINDVAVVRFIVEINEGNPEEVPSFSYFTHMDESTCPVCKIIYNNFKTNMESVNDMLLSRGNLIKFINEQNEVTLYSMSITLHNCNLMHACEVSMSIYSMILSEEESKSTECDITINMINDTISILTNNANSTHVDENNDEEEETTYEKDNTDNEEEIELIPINKAEEEHETSDNSIDNHEEESIDDNNSDSTEDDTDDEEGFVLIPINK